MTLEEKKEHWLTLNIHFSFLLTASKIIRDNKKRNDFLFYNPMSEDMIKILENEEKIAEIEKLIPLIESEINKVNILINEK
jgi:hypothetical protein